MRFGLDVASNPGNPFPTIDSPMPFRVFAQFNCGLAPLAAGSGVVLILEMVGAHRKMNQPLKIAPVGTVEPVPELLPDVVSLEEPACHKLPMSVLEKLDGGWRWLNSTLFCVAHK